jgi:hypothetical protein
MFYILQLGMCHRSSAVEINRDFFKKSALVFQGNPNGAFATLMNRAMNATSTRRLGSGDKGKNKERSGAAAAQGRRLALGKLG